MKNNIVREIMIVVSAAQAAEAEVLALGAREAVGEIRRRHLARIERVLAREGISLAEFVREIEGTTSAKLGRRLAALADAAS